jgi:hypothetical protein
MQLGSKKTFKNVSFGAVSSRQSDFVDGGRDKKKVNIIPLVH